MSEHTPGPWTIAGPYRSSSDTHPSYRIDASDRCIGSVYAQDASSALDARLIAAAPMMLAALKMAVRRADIGLSRYSNRRTPECQTDYDACVAAIAEAEGRK